MSDMDTLFKNRRIKPQQLLTFGFSELDGVYTYSTGLVDGQFEMTVTIGRNGEVLAEVIDSFSKEPYTLHLVSDAKGAFVGMVRQGYWDVLNAVAVSCFESDVFRSDEAGQLLQYVKNKYHSEPEFLWKRFSDNAILRRRDTAKWYAALLTVQKNKLGLAGDGKIEIIDLRVRPAEVDALVDGRKYFPGYHMNKKHWFTICLDGSVPVEEIFERIDQSFVLAVK